MSLEIVTKDGRKLGEFSDNEEKIIIKGKKYDLNDAYEDEDVREAFNNQLKQSNENTENQNTDIE